jgi:hypothetical protein
MGAPLVHQLTPFAAEGGPHIPTMGHLRALHYRTLKDTYLGITDIRVGYPVNRKRKNL